MRPSFHIHIDSFLSAPATTARPRFPIRHSQVCTWRGYGATVIEQHFDGRYGYLYSYEIQSAQAMAIDITVSGADLHGLYVLQSDQPVQVMQVDQAFQLTLAPHRARFLYAARGSYAARIPVGLTVIFGFMVDAGIFRRQRRPLPHLAPLLNALAAGQACALESVDFTIGPITRNHILTLCQRLNPRNLSHESLILDQLIGLVKLSREKLLEEQEKLNIQPRHVEKARRLLTEVLEAEYRLATLHEIAQQLGVNETYLNRLHVRQYQCSFRTYRNEVAIQKAKALLLGHSAIKNVAYTLGFSDVSTFCRFFKKMTGGSPGSFIRKHRKP